MGIKVLKNGERSMANELRIKSKVTRLGKTEFDSLSTSSQDSYSRAIGSANLSLAPFLWSQWSKFYQPQPVAGTEIEGSYGTASFVLRVPERWNGRLVSAATPATRNQFSLDLLFSDYVLERGYAYLCSDKGTPGKEQPDDPLAHIKNALLDDGAMMVWHEVYSGLTRLIKDYLGPFFLKDAVARKNVDLYTTEIPTYGLGVSNGGYVVRYALENDDVTQPVFNGGLDWEGVCWLRDSNLITSMCSILACMRDFDKRGEQCQEQLRQQLMAQGVPDCPVSLWRYYDEYYWSAVFHIYRDYFDRGYEASLPWKDYIRFDENGIRIKLTDTAVVDYDWNKRRPVFEDKLYPLLNTGNIRAPLISLFGTMDCLTLPQLHGARYQRLVEKAGCSKKHRLYFVDKGSHIESLVNSNWDEGGILRPMLPFAQGCFQRLVHWVEEGVEPPLEQTF